MKQLFNILAFALLLPAVVFAAENPHFKGKYTKEKKLHKEYTVNAIAELSIDNSYGNIDIVTWNENRVVINVHIKTNGNNEEKVQKKLDDIDVEFSANSSRVSARTIFNGKKNSSWSWWGSNNSNVKMEINYTIKMPVTNSVELSNDYGSISLNRLEGSAKISCDYGQLNLGELMAENNSLNFDYTKNSTISYMKSGRISADYSGFTVEKAERLEINADYTHAEIEDVKSLNYNSDYGKINIGSVNNLIGRGDYIPLNVGTVKNTMNINTDYGSVTVDRIAASMKEIIVNAEYAGIKLGYESGCNFDFVIDLSYASLKGEEDLAVMKTSKDHSDKFYSGYYGRKGSGNTINIRSDYGGVTLQKL